MHSQRSARATLSAFLGAVLALLAAPAGAVVIQPVFSIAYGANTVNAPFDFSQSAVTPLSNSIDVVTDSVFGPPAKRVRLQVESDRGAIRTLNSMNIFGFFSPNRSETVASFKAQVSICDASSTTTCISPAISGSIPIPYPNISRTAIYSFDNASGFSVLSVKVNNTTLANDRVNLTDGNAAGVTSGVISQRLVDTTGPVPTTGLFVAATGGTDPADIPTFLIEVRTASLIGCSQSCGGTIDETHTINFIEDELAFLGLPDGYTIFAPDLNIFNNRWISPAAATSPGPSPVPEPTTLALFLAGVMGVGFLARRKRRATEDRI